MTPRQIASLMNREDRRAVLAVARVSPQIASAVEMIVASLRRGGRLFFVGAGTDDRRTAGSLGRRTHVRISPTTGPEVLAGSTRLKAGTATKLVLNTLTTASMTGLGRVYGNRMVDLQPRSAKLRERALRLVAELGGVSRPRARKALNASRRNVRLAIVMARSGLTAVEALRALATAGGSLRTALQNLPRT